MKDILLFFMAMFGIGLIWGWWWKVRIEGFLKPFLQKEKSSLRADCLAFYKKDLAVYKRIQMLFEEFPSMEENWKVILSMAIRVPAMCFSVGVTIAILIYIAEKTLGRSVLPEMDDDTTLGYIVAIIVIVISYYRDITIKAYRSSKEYIEHYLDVEQSS
jgi:hypothetical protein